MPKKKRDASDPRAMVVADIILPIAEALENRRMLSVSLGNLSGSVSEPAPAGGGQTYLFSLSSAGSVSVATTGTVSLLNSSNHALVSSTKGTIPFTAEPAGSYSIKVTGGKAVVVIIGEQTGKTRATAHSLGTIDSSSHTLASWIGDSYADNYYSFKLAKSATVAVQLMPQNAGNAQVALTDANGNVLSTGGTANSINRTLGAGSYYLHVNQRMAGNHGNFSLSVKAAAVTPAVLSVTPPASATYYAGQTLFFSVQFSAPVVVTGNPYLDFTLGGVTRRAAFSKLSGNSAIFVYVVTATDNSWNVMTLGPIVANGGTIRSSTGTNASLAFSAPAVMNFVLQGVTPIVTSVTPPAGGTYHVGQSLIFIAHFNLPVNVTQNPTLLLNDRYAVYASGSGTSSLTFTYTVKPGDSAPGGLVLTGSIGGNYNGGSIETAAGWGALLTFTPPSTPNILIDGVTAFVTQLTLPGGSYTVGEKIVFTVPFSLPVIVTGSPMFCGAAYTSGSGTNTLTFTYTVPAGDYQDSLRPSFYLNGGTIEIANGSDADLSLTGVPITNQDISIDGRPFSIVNLDAPTGGNYGTGQTLKFIAQFDAAVTVTGTPQLQLNLGTSTGYASYVGPDPVTRFGIDFAYTIQPGDSAPSGVTLQSPLVLQGASITDMSGSQALTTFNPPSMPAIIVLQSSSTTDIVTPPPAGTYIAGQTLDFSVNFSQPVDVTGAPELPLNFNTIGVNFAANATYASGSGTSTLTFTYTVQPTDYTSNVTALSPLNLNGGSIQTSSGGTPAPLDFIAAGFYGLVLNGGTPKVYKVVAAVDGDYNLGDALYYEFDLTSGVTVGANAELPLDFGDGVTRYATLFETSGQTSVLKFQYLIQPGDFAPNGVVAGPILLNGGTLNAFPSGAPADLTFTPPPSAGVIVDSSLPTIISLTAPSGTYNWDQTIWFTVTLSQPVYFSPYGSGSIQINIGGTMGYATYSSASKNTLTFRYTVQPGDSAPAGLGIVGPFNLYGSSLATNPSQLVTLNLVPFTMPGVIVDGSH